MLEQLRIRNLAVVEDLTLRFEPRLNLLTGETGAGKSIIVGSLTLLTGGRAGPDLVRSGKAGAEVEAVFHAGPGGGGDGAAPPGARLVARREIHPDGRSVASLNGETVPVARLRGEVGTLLSIHGQHSQHGLLRPAACLDWIDTRAGLAAERRAAGEICRRLRDLEAEIERLEGDPGALRARRETLEQQVAEIRAAGLRPGEPEALRGEREILRNAERYREACRLVDGELESDAGTAAAVNRLAGGTRELAGADERFREYLDRSREFLYLLQDLGREVSRFQDRLDSRPDRLAEVESRLARLESLLRRYGGSPAAVLQGLAEAELELDRLRDIDGSGRRLRRERDRLREEYGEVAAGLSGRRRAAAAGLEADLAEELRRLAFPRRTTVQIEVVAVPAEDSPFLLDGSPVAWGPLGWDSVDLRIAPNPGEPPRPLARIASGGELSRIFLAVQTLAAGSGGTPTLVFDEVDAGVGAEIAVVVGNRLGALAEYHQVIGVTHWAQVAARAHAHFFVEKRVQGGRTRVQVRRLEGEERMQEIARMLGGKVAPASSLQHARELLSALSPGAV